MSRSIRGSKGWWVEPWYWNWGNYQSRTERQAPLTQTETDEEYERYVEWCKEQRRLDEQGTEFE